jgi:phosphatidylglycerol:prolipoprotein diacylglycerol transferase
VHWYGILIVTGILLGSRVAGFLAKEYDRDPEAIWDMLMIVVICAIVGARVYHVFSQPESGMLGWNYYKENPIEAFFIWNGGLGIYGALIGGVIGVAIYAYFHQLRLLRWLDFIAPGAAIGQSIGRWGNYMNRELYGPPTTLPWGLKIPPLNRIESYNDMTQYPPDTLFQPTFLYESLATLALCILLIWIALRFKAQLREGDLVFGYLMGYAVVRFFTEFLRPDAWMMGSLAAAQVFALLFFGLGLLVLVGRRLLNPAD